MTINDIQRVTTTEFEAFITHPENAARRFELIDGEIVEKAMPTEQHGMIEGRFSQVLNNYFDVHAEIEARVVGNARYRPTDDPENDRLPDVAVVLGNRPITRRGAANFIPHLCIEIQSPDDRLKTMRKKADFYLENGALCALVVRPDKRTIEVYSADDEIAILSASDTLTFPDLLPGFSVSVDKLFPPANPIEDES